MNGNKKMRKNAFSLIELVIVIVILGIIAAIAIPRISSGSKNAGEAALRGNLQSIRNAIDWYYGDHNNVFPAANGDGTNVQETQAAFFNQLNQYSDANGTASPSKDPSYPFGPYLRSTFPKLTVGSNAGKNTVAIVNKAGALSLADATGNEAWIYNVQTGEFRANASEQDADGNQYFSW